MAEFPTRSTCPDAADPRPASNPFPPDVFERILERGERNIRAILRRRHKSRCGGTYNEAVSLFHFRLMSMIAEGRVRDATNPMGIAMCLSGFAVRTVLGDGSRHHHHARWVHNFIPISAMEKKAPGPDDREVDNALGQLAPEPTTPRMEAILNEIRGVVPGLEFRMLEYMAQGYTRHETARRFNIRPKDFVQLLRRHREILRWAVEQAV